MKCQAAWTTAAVAVTTLLAVNAQADPFYGHGVTTFYGQDPVPNTQFWDYQVYQGYGFDKVPKNAMDNYPYQTYYGLDGVPDSQYYQRTLEVLPAYALPRIQVLTGAERSGPKAPRGGRAVQRGAR